MSPLSKEESQQLRDSLEDIKTITGQLASGSRQAGIAHISVNAGGAGIWIACTCCIVVLAVTLIASAFIAVGYADINRQMQELRQKDDAFQAYVNMGFVKPEEDEKK